MSKIIWTKLHKTNFLSLIKIIINIYNVYRFSRYSISYRMLSTTSPVHGLSGQLGARVGVGEER